MATDYDAPRKTDEDTESIQALQERVPDKLSGVVDVDDSDNPGFELEGRTSPTSTSTSSFCRLRRTSSPASTASS